MILGIGNDITDIRRIEKTLLRFKERFEQRVFTDHERRKAASRQKAGLRVVAGTYAKRFAAKEACGKALGTGLSMGTRWRDMEVVNLPSGQPTLQLYGRALLRLQAMAPEGMEPVIHLTLTDEYPLATAMVIISAQPKRLS
ncbi:MAG: holo-ACP synthase [Rickettsiales bacterium]|nr:holo-ACP synthase [Rickettsiales bacterium]